MAALHLDQGKQTQTYALARIPQDDDELYWTVRALWGFNIPRTKVCKDHCAPFDAFADAFFARSPVSVWKASRGFGGKTNMLSLLALTEAVLLNAQSSVLGGSGAQSQRVHEASQEAWSSPHAPMALLAKDITKYDTHFVSGAWIRSLMASQASVRGPHPQRLRLDEIDEMDLDILEAAQGQPMSGKKGKQKGVQTQTVMSSTHQYPDKTMTEMLKRAKQNKWNVWTWCYRESSNPIDGWLTDDEIERKRTEVSKAMFSIEYDLQEPSFEGRAIDQAMVEACFDPALGEFEGNLNERIIIKMPEVFPRGKAPYRTGTDWAKENDFTVIATFDSREKPWVCIAWERTGRMPWPIMVGKLDTRMRTYGGKSAHDATGLGNVVSDYLADKTDVEDIVLGGRLRADIFTEYITAIEAGEIKYPRIEWAYQEHRYVTNDDLYGRGHPPDSVVAGALAWHLRKRRSFTMNAPTGDTRSSSPWSMA
jgi:hypothetical protein